MKKDLVATALSVFFSCLMITQTYATETAEELYQKGVLLSEQWQPAADEYIKKAADLGNAKAMCLWAEMNKPSMFVHTEESIRYYEKAKNAGALCGYRALMSSNDVDEAIRGKTPSKLVNEFISVAEKKAASGDSDALVSLASFYELGSDKEMEYLKKAATLNNALAMRNISNLISGGHDGWYLIPGSRKRAVREWMEKSGEAGNPLAMLDLGRMYYDEDKKESEEWYKKAVDKGFFQALGSLASAYDHLDKKYKIKFEYNPKKAYELLYPILMKIGSDSPYYQMAKDELAQLDNILSKEEIKEAKKNAEAWMKTHEIRDYTVEFGMYL